MSSAQKLKQKLFGQGNQSQQDLTNLTINIPAARSSTSQPILPKSKSHYEAGGSPRTRSADGSRSAGAREPTYRSQILRKLGTQYTSVEEYRLDQDRDRERHWKRWGPYLSERQWATVREDYSANGDAWSHFPHDHARSRAYRWGEDGIGGICDNHGRLCWSLALWNEEDDILKERLFGVTGHQGNHGEDVKELYWYLDSTPTHSFMKFLYKYPQCKFPYDRLVQESVARSREVNEFESMDTGIFDDDRYWDVFIEYAKDADDPQSISIRVTAYNRGPDPANLHIIPQLWFANTWSWSLPTPPRPVIREASPGVITARHSELSRMNMYCSPSPPPVDAQGHWDSEENGSDDDDDSIIPELIFTENDTNFQRLYGGQNKAPFVKDAFHDHIISGHRPVVPSKAPDLVQQSFRTSASSESSDESDSGTPHPEPQFVNPDKTGTKAAAHYSFRDVPGRGGCVVVRLKLTPNSPSKDPAINDEELFDLCIEERRTEADEFYNQVAGPGIGSPDLRSIMRQALAGMLWSKQYYQFIQNEWLQGDRAQPPPPPERKWVRNKEWRHLHIADVLSMPDKWEYPFFAAWDTAFHCIPLALVDPDFAKKQLDLFTREWYMKPDGQIPAYEWNFSDVNPPVHAWATFRVFKIERKLYGREDLQFLERVFQKLLLNFTWWVNRKDKEGKNVFEGGFLGLDNIGAFNRSEALPNGGTLRQADGTAWMAFFCLNMLNMALELAKHNPVYEDIASKFFEHFIFIADAMTYSLEDGEETALWNEEEGLYFDAIQWGDGSPQQIPVRSLVGLIPLYATLTLEPSVIEKLPSFKKRMEWFIENRPEISQRNMANMKARGRGERRLLALASKERLERILQKMLDENEFLSDYGIRSLSLYHEERPFEMWVNSSKFSVEYWPGDSKSGMFGGNSNWRGPIWLAVNFLLIESLQRFHQYYGPDFQIECPTGSGDFMDLGKVAEEIQHRIIHIFSRDMEGRRATNGGNPKMDRDPHFRDYVLFHEFFHGNDGRGLGASHQTGWTGLVAYHIVQSGVTCRLPRTPRTPKSVSLHYFDEHIDTISEAGDQSAFDLQSARSVVSAIGDLSPDAL
ncbi:uncharacterized protein EI90DRAFT_2913018 [Cantharellus anzutake]|uniref:uncharacterized protein n=1 Tax=Cantharellus anzutake TaxID=1750568 RepID=UPI0019079551|nr:uncharacterized protein EI90DRAFT_2913018 [Cantharellus anzutake]KAF8335749.1 hypothetical protein EI90DRAFT_2913018 [Cantharellus anzutake]